MKSVLKYKAKFINGLRFMSSKITFQKNLWKKHVKYKCLLEYGKAKEHLIIHNCFNRDNYYNFDYDEKLKNRFNNTYNLRILI